LNPASSPAESRRHVRINPLENEICSTKTANFLCLRRGQPGSRGGGDYLILPDILNRR
jgi:hypothetical protein